MIETKEVVGREGLKIEFKVHKSGRRGKQKLKMGEAPPPDPDEDTGRMPRITRLLALALHLKTLLEQGVVKDNTHIADITSLSCSRITQIMNLTLLAPAIQEEILFLPKIHYGRDPITEHELRSISRIPRWDMQVREWQSVKDLTGS